MNRPTVLARCLSSILMGTHQPEQIIVSDDSDDSTEARDVCAAFARVLYVAGPRKGLSANRNAVIRQATTAFVSLLDDDAIMSRDFVSVATEMIGTMQGTMILTGVVIENGLEITPNNPSFWGHFAQRPKTEFKNINLNCNVFPRSAFLHAEFDEAIEYGYEDTDLCAALRFRGYKIIFCPRLVNEHHPPPRNPESIVHNRRLAEKARFYTSLKRFLYWEKSYLHVVAYVILAPCHRIGRAIKKHDWADIRPSVTDIVEAFVSARKVLSKEI